MSYLSAPPAATRARIVAMIASGAPKNIVMRETGVSLHHIRIILRETGTESRYCNRVPIPDDFAAVAPTISLTEACQLWETSKATLYRWCQQYGVQFDNARQPAPPATFDRDFRVMSKSELARLYGVGVKVVARWAADMPADAKAAHKVAVYKYRCAQAAAMNAVRKANSVPKPVKVKTSRRAAPGSGVTWGKAKAIPVPDAKADIVSMAMRHLMRDYVPVHRSETVAGKAGAGMFRVGRMVVNEAELMALAARKGFAVSSGFAG